MSAVRDSDDSRHRGSLPLRRSTRPVPASVWRAACVALLANSADTFLLFLLLWIAQPQGWSGIQTALVVLALRLPTLAAGVLIGRAIDRWGVLLPMVIDLTGRSGLLAILFLLSRGGDVPMAAVLLLGGLAGTLSPATYAAIRTLVPRIVAGPHLVKANAVVAVSDQIPLLLGTVLLAPAIAAFGASGSLAVPVVLLLLALSLAATLPRGTTSRSARTTPADGGARRPNWTTQVVAIVALSTMYYFVYGPFETAAPAYVRDQLAGDESTYGLLWTLFGAGALAALPFAPRLARRRPGVVNAVGAILWGLVMLPLAFIQTPVVAAAVFLIGGLVWGPYTTVETTALQRWVDPAKHGAVFGLQRSLLTTATPLGAACGAIALDAVSPEIVLGVSAAACSLAGAAAPLNRGLRTAH